MYTINDSMLTLILRFAGHNQAIAFSDQEFIQEQLKAIQEYVEQYPSEEKQSRAIEWIAMRARKYRKTWEKESITNEVSSHRCLDCPLSEPGVFGHCQIHEQWLALLQQYAADEINSRQYIESSLEMLAQNKEHLRVKRGMLIARKA
jgi:predicted metal-dependent hydrolase